MKVVILGAGYAGLRTALNLRRLSPAAEIHLVSASPYHVLMTRLHEVAAGSAQPADVTVPLDQIPGLAGTQIHRDTVVDVDPADRSVRLASGLTLSYDYLVAALGAQPEYYGIPGLATSAMTLSGIDGALAIRERIDTALQACPDTGEPVRIVVGGGGLTGVELAAELAFSMKRQVQLLGLPPQSVRLHLVEAAPSLLPTMAARTRENARCFLERLGVTVHLGEQIEQFDDGVLYLRNASGQQHRLRPTAMIWTGGVRGNSLLGRVFPSDNRQRVLVDAYLRVPAYPEVFVIGDAAHIRRPNGQPVPPTAQAAVAQGALVARNLALLAHGLGRAALEPYNGVLKGTIASLGPNYAVGELGSRIQGGNRMWRWVKGLNERYYLYTLGLSLREKTSTASGYRDARTG